MIAEIQSRIIAIEHSPQATIPPEQVAHWAQQMQAVGQQMHDFRAYMPQAVRDTFNHEIEPFTQFAHQQSQQILKAQQEIVHAQNNAVEAAKAASHIAGMVAIAKKEIEELTAQSAQMAAAWRQATPPHGHGYTGGPTGPPEPAPSQQMAPHEGMGHAAVASHSQMPLDEPAGYDDDGDEEDDPQPPTSHHGAGGFPPDPPDPSESDNGGPPAPMGGPGAPQGPVGDPVYSSGNPKLPSYSGQEDPGMWLMRVQACFRAHDTNPAKMGHWMVTALQGEAARFWHVQCEAMQIPPTPNFISQKLKERFRPLLSITI